MSGKVVAIYGIRSSSRPNVIHIVQRYPFGYSCDCEYFAVKGQFKGTCKHIEQVRNTHHTQTTQK